MNLQVLPSSRLSLLIRSIIAGIIYLVLFGAKPIEAQYDQEIMSTRPSMENLNVLKKPLALFSKQPLTGFYRDGYCRTGAEDQGNHAVAAVVTKDFLDYSASKGNDLRTIGLTDGCKWCLCTTRWKEALDGFKNGEIGEKAVPKVFLHATDESALKKIAMEDLKKFAAPGEANSPESKPVLPGSKPSAAIKEI